MPLHTRNAFLFAHKHSSSSSRESICCDFLKMDRAIGRTDTQYSMKRLGRTYMLAAATTGDLQRVHGSRDATERAGNLIRRCDSSSESIQNSAKICTSVLATSLCRLACHVCLSSSRPPSAWLSRQILFCALGETWTG